MIIKQTDKKPTTHEREIDKVVIEPTSVSFYSNYMSKLVQRKRVKNVEAGLRLAAKMVEHPKDSRCSDCD